MISRASADVAASGFSTSTCTPRPASSRTALRCSSVGTATIAKSGRAVVEQLVDRVRTRGAGRATAAVRVARRVDGAGERPRRASICSRRAWWRPIMPRPSTAPRSGERFGGHGAGRVPAMSGSRAPGLVLSATATVGRDVVFGANVVVHDGVVIGDGVLVQDGAVLGKPASLAPWSSAPPGRRASRSSSRTARGSSRRRSSSPGRAIGERRDRRRPGVRPRAGASIGADTRRRARLVRRQRRDDRRARAHPDAASTSRRTRASRTTSSSARAR